MEKEWQDLLYEFEGPKSNNAVLNMIVAILWYILMVLSEKQILTRDDAIKMRKNVKEISKHK